MSKFTMIEKLGLKVKTDYRFGTGYPIVNAMELESILKSAHAVWSTREPNERTGSALWDEGYKNSHTYQAILLAVEPIKKKTKAQAALELLKKLAEDHDKLVQPEQHVKEAKRILEMKDGE